MSMSDPIADMLTRMRNAQLVRKETVLVGASKIKEAILEILLQEGYILGYERKDDRNLEISLKYYVGEPVMAKIRRVSRPGLRRYKSAGDIELVLNGLGIAIISTSQGVMTDHQARELGIGGEVLCHIS